MPTDAQQLATIKSQILAMLVDLTENPKPSYDIDGQDIEWNEYQQMLFAQLKDINAQIAAETPAEIHSQAWSC
jgi:hypothetical protein